MSAQNILRRFSKVVLNVLIIAIFFIPFYWMILTSIKTISQTMVYPPEFWVNNPQWVNFKVAFETIPFLYFLKNSVVVTLSVMLLQLVTVVPAAYAFARYEFKGKNLIFGIILATMMIPAQLIFLPVFVMFSKWGLINNLLSLILPFATSTFGIFMLRQTFKQVPEELLEAARLDEAGEFKIIYKIMLPIAKPTVITLALLTFISTWNDYFWPMTMTTTDAARTLPVGIVSLKMAEGNLAHHTVMAGNVMLILPIAIAFFMAQKQVMKAFTYMGEK